MDALGIIRQMEGDPALRAQMRAVLLGDEMLELPSLVRHLAESQERTSQQLGKLIARIDELAEQVARLTAAQVATETQLGELARAQAATETRLGELADSTARRFDAVEARLDELTAAQVATETRLGELARAQAATETRLGELADSTARRFDAVEARLYRVEWDLDKVRDDLGDVKGSQFELKVRDNPRRFVPRRLAASARLVGDEQLTALLEALDSTAADDVERADALIEAHLPGGGLAVLVVEASWTAHVDDVERAQRRCEALRASGVDARALVVSHVTPAEPVLDAARQARVALMAETDGLLVLPAADAA